MLLRSPINAGVITHTHLFVLPFRSEAFTAPLPRGTVADAYRQALNTGLRPVAASGTSPPPRRAGPLKALHTLRSHKCASTVPGGELIQALGPVHLQAGWMP
jgi:hypothetical protein